MPSRLAHLIDRLNEAVGRSVAWLAIVMVLIQVSLVLMRYVFGIGSIPVQEALVYAHGALFLLASGYALRTDSHVRIDIFYGRASPRRRAWVDAIGTGLLPMVICAVILWVAWPYVLASWAVLESSRETSGLPAVFLQKTLILVFAGLLGLQGLSCLIKAAGRLAVSAEPGAAPFTPPLRGEEGPD